MQPTLRRGSIALVRPCDAACVGTLTRGQMVVVRPAGREGAPLIKRVVALGGDRVEFGQGILMVNGRTEKRRAVIHPQAGDAPGSWHRAHLSGDVRRSAYRPTGESWGPILVPSGAVFVLGDNRQNSRDSRALGPIRTDEITSRVVGSFALW